MTKLAANGYMVADRKAATEETKVNQLPPA